MPIVFTCPHCETTFHVADQNAGQRRPCSACGTAVTIPSVTNGSEAARTVGAGAGRSVVVIVATVVSVGVGVIAIFLALVLPGMLAARDARHRTECMSNLKQIGVALRSYHDRHGCFPPAYFADKEGKPAHSWRVIILPELGEQSLYNKYKLDEPWDSPNNMRVAEQMPRVYRCSSGSAQKNTDYMVIVGKETPFHGSESSQFQDILDGTRNTILVIEVKGSSAKWTEPKDIEFANCSFTASGGPLGDFGSGHPSGSHAVMCDLAVRLFDKDTPPDTIRVMATKAGLEPIPVSRPAPAPR